ncbi:hypothetical protein F2Q68_00012543 [Brassica cretica]|uniref:3'(2'),5'-bisphosphate nucleotidase n=1 Tax=Brassica cretica TaxID=69181 RepID=A0A8S9L1H7_BRACR|nr:hypothetical protein F2Q68_00012543 [Brassica cretica]
MFPSPKCPRAVPNVSPSRKRLRQTKYAGLSRGDGEVYLRFTRKPRPESIWNHAAGSILVSEAGGKVTDAEGNPLDFSKGKYLDYKRGIVVITQKLIAKAFESGKRIH